MLGVVVPGGLAVEPWRSHVVGVFDEKLCCSMARFEAMMELFAVNERGLRAFVSHVRLRRRWAGQRTPPR
jgi:hypothetical protein